MIDGIRERAAGILRDGAYQTALPRELQPDAISLHLGWLALLVRVLLYGTVAAIVLFAAVWLVRRLAPSTHDTEDEGTEALGTLPVPIIVTSADTLAAEGRFGDAIHALLLDTLEALSRAARLAPSLTSREIVARASLPERARDALVGLVIAVEVSRFGGATPGEAEYRTCLEQFHAFLGTYRSAA